MVSTGCFKAPIKAESFVSLERRKQAHLQHHFQYLKVMTDKEHGITAEHPASDWKETWGLQKNNS